MTTSARWLVAAGVAALAMAVAASVHFRTRREILALDLLADFPSARRQPKPDAVTLVRARISGDTKQALLAQPLVGTRITWRETIPTHAWLKVSLGIEESAWTMPDDDVLFMVGISDQRTYDQLLSVTINPFGVASDRRWTDVSLDLSSYGGRTVDIIFNTRSSPKNDRKAGFALWGAPRIIVRQ